MPRLIQVFAGCTSHFVGFVMRRLIYCLRLVLNFGFACVCSILWALHKQSFFRRSISENILFFNHVHSNTSYAPFLWFLSPVIVDGQINLEAQMNPMLFLAKEASIRALRDPNALTNCYGVGQNQHSSTINQATEQPLTCISAYHRC